MTNFQKRKPFTIRRLSLIGAVFGTAPWLQGCSNKDDPGKDGQCTGSAADDIKKMVGCWQGYTNINDFWVNLSNDGDDKLKATVVQGPTHKEVALGSQTGPLGDAKHVIASYAESDYKLSLDNLVLTAADSDSEQPLCTRFSDDKGNVMYKIDCPAVCKKSDIATTWDGNGYENSDGDKGYFTLDLKEGGKGTWNEQEKVSWSYDPDIPDAGLTIQSGNTKLHLVPANATSGGQTCDIFVGQTSPSGNGPDINGVTLRLDKHSKK